MIRLNFIKIEIDIRKREKSKELLIVKFKILFFDSFILYKRVSWRTDMTMSDSAYERSCRIALECGYRKVIAREDDKRAYRGSYFVKKGKLWIHDIHYLMSSLHQRGYRIDSDLDLERFQYNVSDYYNFNDTEMDRYIEQLEMWRVQEELARQDQIGEICRNEHINQDEVDDINEYLEQRGYDRFSLTKNKSERDWDEIELNDQDDDIDDIDDEQTVINLDENTIHGWKSPTTLHKMIENKLQRRLDAKQCKIHFPRKYKVSFK